MISGLGLLSKTSLKAIAVKWRLIQKAWVKAMNSLLPCQLLIKVFNVLNKKLRDQIAALGNLITLARVNRHFFHAPLPVSLLGTKGHIGSAAVKDLVFLYARLRQPPQKDRYLQRPHGSSYNALCRINDSFWLVNQISSKRCLVTLPITTLKNGQGITSPLGLIEQEAMPAVQPPLIPS